MKKFAAILLYCFACAIHFGHSIIPHSHPHEHGAKDHNHPHENESESIFDLFAHYGQAGETFTSPTAHEITVSENWAPTGDYIAYFHEANFTVIYKFLPCSFAEPYIYISPHLTNFHFRGPPSLI